MLLNVSHTQNEIEKGIEGEDSFCPARRESDPSPLRKALSRYLEKYASSALAQRPQLQQNEGSSIPSREDL